MAIDMISPGPVVISATFVGYLLDGVRGAVAATLGIFVPAVLFTVLAACSPARHATSDSSCASMRLSASCLSWPASTNSGEPMVAISSGLTLTALSPSGRCTASA